MMARHLFLAIALMGTGVLFIAPADAATALQCEDRAVSCGDRCADVTGGAGDSGGHQNKCIRYCGRQVSSCLSNAYVRR